MSKRKFRCYLFRGESRKTPNGARPVVIEAKVYVSPPGPVAGFFAEALHRERGEIGCAVGADEGKTVASLLASLRKEGWRESMTMAGEDARRIAGKRSARAFMERGGDQ